jgi:hypothetical protein
MGCGFKQFEIDTNEPATQELKTDPLITQRTRPNPTSYDLPSF